MVLKRGVGRGRGVCRHCKQEKGFRNVRGVAGRSGLTLTLVQEANARIIIREWVFFNQPYQNRKVKFSDRP